MKSKIIETIEKYDSIVLFGHVNPDGDSFGSQIAMKAMINENYPDKKVYVAGTGIRNMYSLFGKPDVISDDIIKNSLAIAQDFNVLYRSEDQRIKLAPEIIMIDHHEPYNGLEEEFPISIIRSNISANCTILYELFKQEGLKMNLLCRNALFYGITTDTNRFMYLEENQESFKVGYDLMVLGVDMTDIYYHNSRVTEASLRLKGYVLSNYKLYGDKVIYCILPKDEIIKSGFKGYPGYLVNQMANVDDRESWLLFIQNNNDNMSVEIRSAKKVVRPVSVKFGGGGHAKACGIQSCEYSNKMINDILKETEKLIKE